MKKLLTFFLICSSFFARAQKEEHFTDLEQAAALHVGTILDVYDDKMFGTGSYLYSTVDLTYYAKGGLIFEYDPKLNDIFISDDITCTLSAYVTTYEDATDSTITLETMVVERKSSGAYKNKAVIYFNPCHRLRINVQQIDYSVNGIPTYTIPEFFRLRSELLILRSYDFLCSDTSSFTTTGTDADHDYLEIAWTPIYGATEYDFEWTFYDDLANINGSPLCSTSFSDYDSLFRNNSTRISTDSLHYRITSAYPSGCLFYRVRGVKVIQGFQRIVSDWNTDVLTTSDFEEKLNRQFNITFAEQGKRKEVFDYFDGSTRNRQSITRDNTSDSSIVGESIYDFHGRPAVKILPAPAFDGTVKYHHRFNIDGSDSSYTWKNFDNGDCPRVPDTMNYESGSEKYYSINNPQKDNVPDKFIPQAEGYPFTITEFTQDQTGRIKRQSGAGKDLMLGTNHETKYYYGKPGQYELDRLFGNDVGDSTHYTQEMTIDPNGQVSVTYKNLLNDKVIATSLVGEPPVALEQLPNFRGDTIITTPLIGHSGTTTPMAIIATYPFMPKSTGPFLFKYTLFPSPFELEDCDNDTICYDCLYDIKVSVSDGCNTNFERLYHNFSLPFTFDSNCAIQDSSIVDSVELTLTYGSYQVTREITVSKDAIDYYTEKFLEHNTCFSFNDLFERELDYLSQNAGCDINCDSCLIKLGDSAAFVIDFLADISLKGFTLVPDDTLHARQIYEIAYKECMLLCHPGNECSMKYELMLMDVSLGGQYCRYEIDDDDGTYSATDPTSILNPAMYPTPGNYQSVQYLDLNGNQIYLTVNGHTKTPDQLTIKEFVEKFQPEWAYSLVELHPEICYYNFCVLNESSTTYDFNMLNTDTYEAAVDSGYFDPMNEDPFFTTGSGHPIIATVSTSLNNYHTVTNISNPHCPEIISIWQMAMLIAMRDSILDTCNITVPSPTDVCIGDRNAYWRAFRSMYYSLKQVKYYSQQALYVQSSSCTSPFDLHSCIGSNIPNYNLLGFNCGSPPAYPNSDYQNKTPRFLNMPSQGIPPGFTSVAGANSWANSTMDTLTTNICAGYRDYWRQQLENSCEELGSSDIDLILDEFQHICEMGVDPTHVMGASTLNPDSSYTYESFEEVMNALLPGSFANDPFCNPYSINLPRPYEEQPLLVTTLTFPEPPACACEKLDSLYVLFFIATGESIIDSFKVYLDSAYGSHLTVSQIDEIRLMCHNKGCNSLEEPIQLPAVLSCDECLSCDIVWEGLQSFETAFTNGTMTPGFTSLFENYLNHRFGFSLKYDQYISFLDSCDKIDKDTLKIVGCDSLYSIYNTYLLESIPRPDVTDWFNDILNLSYTESVYIHWFLSCSLDTGMMNPNQVLRNIGNSINGVNKTITPAKGRNIHGANKDFKHSYNNTKIHDELNIENSVPSVEYEAENNSSNPYGYSISSTFGGYSMMMPCSTLNLALVDYATLSPMPPITLWLNNYFGLNHTWSYYNSQILGCGFTLPSTAGDCGKLNTNLTSCITGGHLFDFDDCLNTTMGINFSRDEYFQWLDSCGINLINCDSLDSAISVYKSYSFSSRPPLTIFLHDYFGITLTWDQWNYLIDQCGFVNPGTYTNCDSLAKYYTLYSKHTTGDITALLNSHFKLSLLWNDYTKWLDSCQIPYIDCEKLQYATNAYLLLNISVRPPLIIWLNSYLNLNLTQQDYDTCYVRCSISKPEGSGSCDSLVHAFQHHCFGDFGNADSCLNSYLGLNLTLGEYILWMDNCGHSLINCETLRILLNHYDSMTVHPPLVDYLNVQLNTTLTFAEYLILFRRCNFENPDTNGIDCTKIEEAYDLCISAYSAPYLLSDCMNSFAGFNYTMSFYIHWMDSCNIYHSFFNCELLENAVNEFPCLQDTMELTDWLNYYFQANHTTGFYEAYFDTCNIDILCCEDISAALDEFPCDQNTTIYDYLNYNFGTSFSSSFWMNWLVDCNLSLECDTCSRIGTLLEKYHCNDSASVYEYLYAGTGWTFTNAQWDSIMIHCDFQIPCHVDCHDLVMVMGEYDCSDSLYLYLNDYFNYSFSDSTWITYLDSCHILIRCMDCEHLLSGLSDFNCEDNITVYEYLNSTYGVALTDSEYIYMFGMCSLVPTCDTCNYLSVMLASYVCNDTLNIMQWFNSNTHWGYSDTTYFDLIDSCGFLSTWFNNCFSCSQFQDLKGKFPCTSGLTFYAWLNDTLNVHFSRYEWSRILQVCPIDSTCRCDFLTSLIAHVPCDSLPLVTWLNDTTGWSLSDSTWWNVLDSCKLDSVFWRHCYTCDDLDSLYRMYPCNSSTPIWAWLNDTLNVNFIQSRWIQIFNTCDPDTSCRCRYLDTLISEYPCDTVPLLTYLNDSTNWGLSGASWWPILDSCRLDSVYWTHCYNCDDLDSLYRMYPCDSPVPIWTWLNDTLNVSFTESRWIQIFNTCDPDTTCRCRYLDTLIMHFPCDTVPLLTYLNDSTNWGLSGTSWWPILDSCRLDSAYWTHCYTCDDLDSLYQMYPCNSLTPIWVWLNDTLNISFTESRWIQIFNTCEPDTTCRCTYLDTLIDQFPCDTIPLLTYLNDSTNWGLSSTTWWDILDSCRLDSAYWIHCYSCDNLDSLYRMFPCNSPVPIWTWLNDTLNVGFTEARWIQIFNTCDPDTTCRCTYLDTLISQYPCDTLPLLTYLNDSTNWGLSSTTWWDILDSCRLDSAYWIHCYSCDDIDSLYLMYPCNSPVPIWAWLNDTLNVGFTEARWIQIFNTCDPDTNCRCNYLDTLISQYPCDSFPLITYLNDNTNWGLSSSTWWDILDSCRLDSVYWTHCYTCDDLDSLYRFFPCGSSTPIWAWLNDTLNINLTESRWIQIFNTCDPDTNCWCDYLTSIMIGFPCPADTVTLSSWVFNYTGVLFSEPQVIQMLIDCGIPIPTCSTFSCVTLNAAMQVYLSRTAPITLTAFLDPIFGPHTTSFYQSAYQSCMGTPGPMLCNEPMFPRIDFVNDTVDDCFDGLYDLAYNNTITEWNSYNDSLRGTFRAAYEEFCMRSAQELLTVTGPSSEYHFTLYYYDQADNLVRTVPPAGVHLLNAQSIDSVQKFRNQQSIYPVYANDSLETDYYYNTLNKVTYQRTPDASHTEFWYDNVGRIVVSRNSNQYYTHKYSYTLYDELGRISEVGQIYSLGGSISDAVARDTALFRFWFTHGSVQRTQVTHTYYDYSRYVFTDFSQDNLRNRVASIIYQDVFDSDSTKYESATHYSYDISGNVKTLLQENRSLASIRRNLKRIDYDYDLVSGKVNRVFYQRDSIDQFIHKYEYDANLRITDVLTSRDALVWDRDATYQYYKHGPLARMETGQWQVQGTDYAYTLQGWIKSINSSLSNQNNEMGQDGLPGAEHGLFGRDAFSMSLGYFENDYKQIGDVNPELTNFNLGNNLFNGNIRQGVYDWGNRVNDIQTLGYTYAYDQLNRLVHMLAYEKMDSIDNTNTGPNVLLDLKEDITYDPNGNIKTYYRNGFQGSGSLQDMDDLTYNYYPGTNQLSYVDDQVNVSNYPADIDDQTGNNYIYDNIGNLVKDDAEQLDSIFWNNYGKIDSIFSSGKQMAMKFRYDPAGNRIEKRFYNLDPYNDVMRKRATHFVRDASGNTMAVYDYSFNDTLILKEFDIYGSSRLGLLHESDTITISGTARNTIPDAWLTLLGDKEYEQTNHLGNVMSTITDKPVGMDTSVIPDNIVDYYNPDFVTAQDYYPFGMLQPDRHIEASDSCYRFGFNGKEKDNEVKGLGNQQNYGFRIYDPRIGRFLSIDPLTKNYPWYTPYQFAGNKPIQAIDLDGKEEYFITDYRDARGNLWKTEVTLVTSAGAKANSQIVHRSTVNENATLNANGNRTFTVNYTGSFVGNTTGSNNAFASPQERELVLGVDNNGEPKQYPLKNPPVNVKVNDRTDGTVKDEQAFSESVVPNGDNPATYVKGYYDAAGNSLGTDPDYRLTKFTIDGNNSSPATYNGTEPAGYVQRDKSTNAVPANPVNRATPGQATPANGIGSNPNGIKNTTPQGQAGRVITNP